MFKYHPSTYAYNKRASCGASVLHSFGIKNQKCGRMFLADLIRIVERKRYTVRPIYPPATLNQFVKTYRTGKFILCVRGHFIAVHNGKLVDTAFCGGKTRIKYAYTVEELL